MKKLAFFLSMLLLMAALLLTGCGVDKNAETGLLNDSVNKVSSNIQETKLEDNSLETDNKNDSSDSDKSQVKPNEADMSETTDNSLSQKDASKIISAPTTTIETNPSSQTSAIQVPIPIIPETINKNTITIAINCATAVAKGLDKQEKFKNVVPANGIILPATEVEFKDGETVFDALKLVTSENKIHLQYEGSKGTPYIKGINNLYEFDSGPLSGWMYCVNTKYSSYGCNHTKLKNGDVIEWNYTCNMGKDLKQ